jgi:glycosyltransferase involved in cell wall biosynthesis
MPMKKEIKRVLYVCSGFSDAFAANIVNMVSESKLLEIYVLVAYKKSNQSRNNYFKVEKNIEFFEYSANPVRRLVDKFYNHALSNKIKKIITAKKIDYVHFLSTEEYLLHYTISQLKKKLSIVYTIHDLDPHETSHGASIKGLKEKLYEKYILWGNKKNIGNADILVTNSRDQYLRAKQIYQEKQVRFHQFPTLITEEIMSGSSTCPELNNINQYILFFGNVYPYKGVELLYKMFLSNELLRSNYYLVIAGSGSWYFERDKNDEKVVRINRYILDSEVKSLFSNAACVVYPYISATQSGVLTLAYKFETPLLVSDVPYFRDNVENYKTGILFKSQDENDLAKKLEELLFQTSIEDMKRHQKQYYEQHYSAESILREIEGVYRTITDK